MAREVVVIGAGQAASAFVGRLRAMDPDRPVTLIGEEPHLPYQRPPLSKKYLMGELESERLMLRSPDWYGQNAVQCLTGRRAVAINLEANSIDLDDGSNIPFDKLFIATGASPRRIPAELGGQHDRVMALRNIADADLIGEKLKPGLKLLIIGGGYIGLEVAAAARMKGVEVTIIEMAERILQRVASPKTSDIFRSVHTEKGVVVKEGTSLRNLEDVGDGLRAFLDSGQTIDCDYAIAAIGISPETTLAQKAGLAVDNGIAVDEHACTSHPDIYAAGDCASFPLNGGRVRLESVQNAIDQAEIAAQNICGERTQYSPVPWFWSDQYDVKLQIAGLNLGYDRIVERPGSHEDGQSIWYFAGDHFIAVDSINDPRAYMVGKRCLENGIPVAAENIADIGFDLKSLLK